MRRLNKPSAHQASHVCPRLEELEGRDVPSYLAAEFPGYGVWRIQDGGDWEQLTAANASQVAANGFGDVVGEFPGQGVWLYSRSYWGFGWQQLTANNAAGLAIGNSTVILMHEMPEPYFVSAVVAEFPGQGLWKISHSYSLGIGSVVSSWEQLTANNATTEAIDGNGNVVASFKGQGTWFYGPGYYSGTRGWQQLTGADATSLAIGSAAYISLETHVVPDVVAAAFTGYGVWRLNVDVHGHPGSWAQLTDSEASAVGVNGSGDVVAEFPGWGVWSFLDSAAAAAAGWHAGWNQLTAADATLVGIDAAGHAYGQFPGWGVWYDQNYTWQCLTASNATSLGVGG
jgi:hypothetical protein